MAILCIPSLIVCASLLFSADLAPLPDGGQDSDKIKDMLHKLSYHKSAGLSG